MAEAARLGADMLNDVRAFQREGALAVAADTKLPVCFMHMQGTPQTMQDQPTYSNVIEEVLGFLVDRKASANQLGIPDEAIWLDPGIGFGKTMAHNVALMDGLKALAQRANVLVGVSKKRLIGDITARELNERVVGSALVGYHALQNGARILRVHDVPSTRDAINVFKALDQ